VPVYTEARIQELCAKALAAEDATEAERILTELRFALEEHIYYAKNSLEAYASVISVLESHNK
jgi:hypothetical protein